jgi:hypothetical protein
MEGVAEQGGRAGGGTAVSSSGGRRLGFGGCLGGRGLRRGGGWGRWGKIVKERRRGGGGRAEAGGERRLQREVEEGSRSCFRVTLLQRDVRDIKYTGGISLNLSHWIVGAFHIIIKLEPLILPLDF